MAKIPDGCVLLARKIQDNPIWYQKPSWWLKVWEYILIRANHKDKYGLKRGQCFLDRETIHRHCHLKKEKITIRSVDNVIRWLRERSMLTTQQTTRGFIITICNYDTYQDLKSYKNESKNEAETKQKRSRNEPINNNDKNVKNEYIFLSQLLGELILKRKPDDKNTLKEQKHGWINWADNIRLMIEQDERKVETIKKVIKWCQEDGFWKTNIRSTFKLREQFDQLEEKMKNKQAEFEHPMADIEYLK